MVKLNFVEFVPAPLGKVWSYFSVFQNIAEWDPNTKKITPVNINPNKVGSTYKIITLWKGSQTQLDYRLTEYEHGKKIGAEGQNGTTHVVDQIFFKQKDNGTQITYVADISLKHVLKVLTPFIMNDLRQLRDDAQNGMRAKIKQLYG